MAIVLLHKNKKQAVAQIKKEGSLIIERKVYLDSEDNVIEITTLRAKAIQLENYKKLFKLSVLVSMILVTVLLIGVSNG